MKKITDFGVFGDGITDVTTALQNAIDECAEKNTELIIEEGTYIVTGLRLPSGSVLNLNKGSKILANPDYKAWEVCPDTPFVFSENAENIVIKGEGEFCCNGVMFRDEVGKRLWGPGPARTIAFYNSKRIQISGIKISDSITWTLHFNNCENVLVDGITIRNLEYRRSNCSDGIDINGSRHIEIKNCDVETGDDAICIKNVDPAKKGTKREPVCDIYVHDCVLATTCNGFKIGTETVGDVYDVRVENIKLKRHSDCADSGYPEGMGLPLSAINIESNDGAIVHDISVKNYHAEIAGTPLFMVLQKRCTITEDKTPGKIYNIYVENFKVDRSIRPSLINCTQGAYIDNVEIKNAELHNFETYKGELKAIQACGRCYPDPYNYGHFPAYGLFGYNVKNLNIHDDVEFFDEADSGRECIIIKND